MILRDEVVLVGGVEDKEQRVVGIPYWRLVLLLMLLRKVVDRVNDPRRSLQAVQAFLQQSSEVRAI